jgi:hypothetical protein
MTNIESRETRRAILGETTRAYVSAHDAELRQAMDSVQWERRGILQTLRQRRKRPE